MNYAPGYGIVVVRGKDMFKLSIILILSFIIIPIYAYAGADSGLAINTASCSFSEWVNTQSSDKPMDENAERIVLREQWERNIGIDIFYPYFKAKELESKVKNRTSVKILNIKGKPEFKNNEARYLFSIKF